MISPFALHQPNSVEDACSLLAQYGEEAKILAGGSELLLVLKMGLSTATHLIDIKRIEGLASLDFDLATNSLQIGPLVTHRTLEKAEVVRQHYPLFTVMEQHIANVRIRNVGTLAGNLCFAEPHADPGTLLCAYDARITLQNASRQRIVDISDFFVDYYTTVLHQDELLTKIEVPKLEESFVGTYMRFCPAERPMATVALLINKKAGLCDDIRLVLGCMGPTPIRIKEVEETLKSKPCDEIVAKSWEMAKQAASVCDPVEDIWGSVEYKRQIVRTLVTRALTQLCDGEDR